MAKTKVVKFLEVEPKPPIKSQTIQGNVLSILATLGTVVAMFKAGMPTEVFYTVLTAAGGSIWGNIMSIFGRVKAVQQIQ